MAQRTDAELISQSEVIRNETQVNANTAGRVANILRDITDSKPNTTAIPALVANNAAVVANTAKRTYPEVDQTKLATIATGAQVNDTGVQIVAKLEALTGEDKLHVTAIGGSDITVNGDQFSLNPLTILTDSVPTASSVKFVTSGSLFTKFNDYYTKAEIDALLA